VQEAQAQAQCFRREEEVQEEEEEVAGMPLRLAVAALLVVAVAVAVAAPSARAATITPTVTTDDRTVNGNCTLREAVLAASGNGAVDQCAAGDAAAPDEILLTQPLYNLTLSGANEDSNLTGDLDVFLGVASPLTITGDNGESSIDGGSTDRVIDVKTSTASSLTLDHVRLDHGSPPAGPGGALRVPGSNSVTLNNSRVTRSTSTAFGGGMQVVGDLTLNDSAVSQNSSTALTGLVGGGIRATSDVTINASTISSNQVVSPDDANTDDIFGGGVAASGGNVSVVDSTIASNTVTALDSADASHGAGIYAENAPLRIEGSTIDANTVSAASSLSSGGGVDYSDLGTINGMLVIQNSTLTDNHSQTDGGALQVGGGNTAIRSSTFTLNSTGTGRSIFYSAITGSSLALGASILSENGTSECAGNPPDSDGFNIDRGTTCGLSGTGDLSSTNPGLLGEADNGGLTLTHALPPGSPALDRIPAASCTQVDGTPLSSDQRGAPRGFDEDGDSLPECDVGAYELNRCQGKIVDLLLNHGLNGTVAADVILGSDGFDAIDPRQGDDTICAGGGDDTVFERPNGGNDAVDGGPGSDKLFLGNAPPASPAGTVDLADSTASGTGMSATLSSIENASGSPADDTLIGDDGPNVLDGGIGSDTVDGGAGPDTLLGGNDDDQLFARDGIGDTVDCGDGAADSAQTDLLSLDVVSGCESVDAIPEPTVVPPQSPSSAPASGLTTKKCKKKKHKRHAAAAKKKKCKKKRRRA
jgi:hypothetical protein